MTSPINFDDLSEIFALNPIDQMITENEPEQATTKATIKQVSGIAIQNLTWLPDDMQSGDVFYYATSSNVNSSVDFDDITFESGTRTWIFAETYPSGWSLVPNTGDKLLAIVGGSKYTTAGTEGGTWLTEGVNGGNPGSGLTIEQIPAHSHRGHKTKEHPSSSEPDTDKDALRGKVREDDDVFRFRYIDSQQTGGGQPHNHSNTFRPRAQVGLIIEKI